VSMRCILIAILRQFAGPLSRIRDAAIIDAISGQNGRAMFGPILPGNRLEENP
jgi:hypothetical protein